MALCRSFSRLLCKQADAGLQLTKQAHSVALKRRGVDHGPATLRAAGLVERLAGLASHIYSFYKLRPAESYHRNRT